MMWALEFHFSSAHFYDQPKWSETKNKSEFGLCYSQFGHGHNYKLVVEAEGDAVMLRREIQKVVSLLDHKHLNHEVDFFKDKIPTSEVIVEFFAQNLESIKPKQIIVYEEDTLGAFHISN